MFIYLNAQNTNTFKIIPCENEPYRVMGIAGDMRLNF